LKTQDGQSVSGFLFACGGEKTALILAHPREHLVPHYLVPEILRGNMAAFLQAPRLTGNDIRLEHEMALYDLAAAVSHLRRLGFEKVVALGNSGGAPLWAFYNQQSLLAHDRRIERTPSGRPTKYATAELPMLDGLVFVSAHLGQGKLLLNGIDPSVIEEGDAFSVDPSLDPFDPDNGYKPDGKSRYAPEFVTRYRAAQADRVRRIDDIALGHVSRRADARRRVKEGGTKALDLALSAHSPIFPVWRTDADLRCWDLTIDPSDRPAGSLWGNNPYASNYGSIGFGRICTPESWLSTWSGFHSNASMERCARSVEQPLLMIEFTGDSSTFPEEVDTLFSLVGSRDKQRSAFAGDHHARALSADAPDPKIAVGACLRDWLSSRFN
jgi:hypothetical protein